MKKTAFDLTHEKKMTMKPDGTLYPIFYQKALPGDSFKGNTEIFGRMIPLVNPVFQRYDVFVHYFFVPDRILWDNFENWLTPEHVGMYPNDSFDFPAFGIQPSVGTDVDAANVDNFTARSLADCFGIQINHDIEYGHLPLASRPDILFSSLPFRAYQTIWNDHYRDVDIQEKILVKKTDGYVDADEANQFNFLKKNWEKDYFTSARPFAQKGEPITVMTKTKFPSTGYGYPAGHRDGTELENPTTYINLKIEDSVVKSTFTGVNENNFELNTGANFTIEQLRWANAMQKYAEKLYRTGTRYKQYLKGFFDVRSSDARLDMSEYIGGGRQPFTIGEVLQTTPTEESPLGTYGGHAVTFGQHKFNYRCEEHGQIIGLVSIMPRASYIRNINKQLVVTGDIYDYPVPDFAHLGNQEIKKFEFSGDLNAETPFEVFGYTDRYAEYKFIPSTTHGLFREDANLRLFHASRIVQGDAVSLNHEFLECSASDDTDRVFAVEMDGPFSTDPVLLNVVNRCTALRPLPKKSLPDFY